MVQVTFRVRAVLEPDEGGFHAYCPALRGCHSWGATRDEALVNIREAAAAYIESMLEHGDPIPVEGPEHVPSTHEEALTVTV
ncbi:type II toxin-antitoxin system HicB family antitoxin [Candidatus Bipolaricaulota bacterium]|nr:type II toxin-antitoxin system HicB family antitoxin [Candidatus Bipolaricaulota bacterium]